MKQFFAPLAETGGVGLCSTAVSAVGPTGILPVEEKTQGEQARRLSNPQARCLCYSETLYSSWPCSEPCVVVSETEAERLVTAIENARPSDVIAIIKRQPWFNEIRSGVRQVRHLKPDAYLELSERPRG